jgi:hypothetical protein
MAKCSNLPRMSKTSRSVLIGLGALVTAVCLDARVARAQEDVPDTPAWRSNVGFVTSIGFAVLIPDEGSAGFGLEPTIRYGIPTGPVIIAPGARLAGYFLSERFIWTLMPTLRVTAPLGPLAPFVHGGVGGGGITNPGEGGLSWLGGGGLMIHFGGVLSLGAELNYQGITGTDYKALSIGPTIVIGG